ncbi:MAG: hypothetical protein ACLTCP_05675 [Ruminococcus bicirculans (ex Wegman et al. 2014)]
MNGCGFGGCWWIIILILIFCCGCGGYGNGCGGCGNGCGGCGCDNGCGGADADLTAIKTAEHYASPLFYFIFFFQTLFKAFHNSFQCFYAGVFLSLPSSIVHGAISVEVSVIMRSTYFS